MIGSIRKHAAWLWWLIAGLTIISFVYFMGAGPGRNGRGSNGGSGDNGKLYGRDLTDEEIAQSERDFDIFFFLNNGEWPDKDPNISKATLQQQVYLNLMFEEKAKSLGIAVPDDVVADAAAQWLRTPALLERLHQSQPISASQFVQEVLQKSGFTGADFEHAVRTQLIVEQLRMAIGLTGSLVTPQEAAELYDQEHQEANTEVVFFSASNYLSQATATPAETAEFFTNNMAYYRVPDRLQVNYVFFSVTNYLAEATAALTNLTDIVEMNYKKYGQSDDFKNLPVDQGKAKLRDLIIRQRAMSFVAPKAQELRDAVYAANPVKPENLATIAKQKGLTVQLSAPFAQGSSAPEFANVRNVEETAFTLTPDSPFSDLIAGTDGIYIIGLANKSPSYIPALADIGARVQSDYRMQMAFRIAAAAGASFYSRVTNQAAAGKSFASTAAAAGQTPVLLSPFSLSSADVPEAGDHAEIRDLKNSAFSTPVGGISPFVPTQEGGFVMHVRSMSPGDASRKTAELPQFIQQMRRGRENEAFSAWMNNEAGHEFPGIPALKKAQSGAAN